VTAAPIAGDRGGVTVLVIPQPTVNGPLHVGHLAGPYLAADIAVRAARARGDRVLALAGVDVHQNYVPARAEQLGVPVGELAEACRGRILEAFGRARIGWDTFLDPIRDPGFAPVIAGFLAELVERGSLPMRELTLHRCAGCRRTLHHVTVAGFCPGCGSAASGGSCEGCGGFTSAQTLTDPGCDRCGGAPEPFRATVPVLRMEEFRDRLAPAWMRADLPPRVRALIGRYLDAGLPEVPLAYPTDWGIEGTGPLAGLRIDVYAELALGYLYGVARATRPDVRSVTDAVTGWSGVRGLWHFHGIDNAFYYGLFIPAMLAAAGLPVPPLSGLVVNEFLLLDGKKFSTSRDHAIWADELLADEDPDLVRLFLCWNRPDRAQTDFTRESWAAFRAWAGPLLRTARAGAGTPGGDPSRALPPELVAAELDRAEDALRPSGFDPALATRAVLAAVAAAGTSERVHRLLDVLTGAGPAADPTAGSASGSPATGPATDTAAGGVR
jgi:methionyl-tRNA synthetase